MGDASGLCSSTSLEKLVLISSDLDQDQIISNYNLPSDSSYSTLILDKSVPTGDISKYLEHDLPPDVTGTMPPGTKTAEKFYFYQMKNVSATTSLPPSTYNVTFSIYFVDMIMTPKVAKDADYSCYFLTQAVGFLQISKMFLLR